MLGTAMTAVSRSIRHEKNFDFAFGYDFFELQQHKYNRQNAAYALTQKSCPRNAGNAHFEGRHKQNIDADVGKRGASKEDKRSAAVAHCRENARCDVVEKHKRQAPHVDVQIEFGVRHNFARRADELQKSATQSKPQNHQNRAQNAACNPGGEYGCFHVVILFCTEKSRNDNRATYVASKRKRNKNERYLIAVSHCGKSVVADKFACDEAVRKVVQLLEDDTSEKRKTKLPNYAHWFADG